MTPDRLTDRALNRATLQRQWLIRRSGAPILDAVNHLVGLQAQEPLNPYVALWSRLDGFDPWALADLVTTGQVVRIVVMRGTLHLVTADDALVLRPLAQPVLDREMQTHSEFSATLAGLDLEPMLRVAGPYLAEAARSPRELRALLAQRFPDHDPGALALACRNRLALVQVPPRGVWGQSGGVRSMTAEAYLGRPLDPAPSIDDVVLRYIAAFGPATVADVAAWSRLTAMAEVVERLRPRLRAFRDERGRDLVDLPHGPRPDPDTPIPPRFLPEYDNVLLSHADRRRFGPDEVRRHLSNGSRAVKGSLLVDGALAGNWRPEVAGAGDAAALHVDHVGRLSQRTASSVQAEGRRLLRMLAPEAATREVRLSRLE